MKKIIFDARLASHPGMGRYLKLLLHSMLSFDSSYQFELLGSLRDLEEFKSYKNIDIQSCEYPIYSMKEQMSLGSLLKEADLAHIPNFNIPTTLPSKVKLVVTIHDLIYLDDRFYQKSFLAKTLLNLKFNQIAKKAHGIIAVSESTKNDCINHFPKMKNKIHVIHEAPGIFDNESNLPSLNSISENISDTYILSVGSVREHKNIQGLLKAYLNLVEKRGRIADLVIVGRLHDAFDKKFSFLEEVKKHPSVHYLGQRSDLELKSLYKKASLFVMPSFFEGFGLPLLEAMSFGLPAVSSLKSSLPEVGGEAPEYFDPDQIDRLEELLYNVLENKDLRQKMANKGVLQSNQFSWKKSAEETLNLYQKLLSQP